MDKAAVIGKLDHVCAVAGRLRDALHASKAATDIDWAGLYRDLQGFEDMLYDEAVYLEAEGTEGQDRESYTDDQDRESYAPGEVVISLTRADWIEIFYALDYKLTSPTVQMDGKWMRHLRTIMDRIGPDGQNMNAE